MDQQKFMRLAKHADWFLSCMVEVAVFVAFPTYEKSAVSLLQWSLLLCFQEDYVKWKGSLFFRIVMCTVDEDESLNKFGK